MVKSLADEFKVKTLCLVLAVSRTAYYRYLRGDTYQATPEKAAHQQLVEQVFRKHKRRYGSPRITAELQENGWLLGRHQVRTLMKAVGLQTIQPKSFVPRTTDSTHGRGYCGAARAAEFTIRSTLTQGSQFGLGQRHYLSAFD